VRQADLCRQAGSVFHGRHPRRASIVLRWP
jgi:hypothetical protein